MNMKYITNKTLNYDIVFRILMIVRRNLVWRLTNNAGRWRPI